MRNLRMVSDDVKLLQELQDLVSLSLLTSTKVKNTCLLHYSVVRQPCVLRREVKHTFKHQQFLWGPLLNFCNITRADQSLHEFLLITHITNSSLKRKLAAPAHLAYPRHTCYHSNTSIVLRRLGQINEKIKRQEEKKKKGSQWDSKELQWKGGSTEQ